MLAGVSPANVGVLPNVTVSVTSTSVLYPSLSQSTFSMDTTAWRRPLGLFGKSASAVSRSCP
jgi:hypothetical protein